MVSQQEIRQELEKLKTSDSELAKLVEDFIEVNKLIIKDKDNKKAKSETKELHKALQEKGFLKENIEKVIRCCENLVDLEIQKE